VFDAFYDDYETLKTFTHGHSFTGNPIATATALETLRIFEDEPVMAQVQESADYLREQMQTFGAFPHVGNIRSLGMIAAFELFADKESKQPYDFTERTGFKAYQAGLEEGLFLRPLGDTLYYWLPLCTTPKQIKDIIERTHKVLLRMNM
jgi:adenosylmethionine-8-amino-7-oxononanoate aminotransferase